MATAEQAMRQDESLAELLGLTVERVDLVGAPAIRRRFVLTKAQEPEETEKAASDKRWASIKESDYTVEQLARACPRSCIQWARKQAEEAGRELTKGDMNLPYKEPDGTPNYWGIRAAISRLPVTDLPAAVKADAEKELRTAFERAKSDLGKEESEMPKIAVEDLRDVASRIAKEDDEAALAALRKEASDVIEKLRAGLDSGEIEAETVEAAIAELEKALDEDNVSKEALKAKIEELRKELPSGDPAEEEEADGEASEGPGDGPEEGEESEAEEEPEEEPEGEESAPETTSEAEAAPEGTPAEPATETAAPEGEADPAPEAEVEEDSEPADPVEEQVEFAEELSEEEQSTLLRALQAIAPFKSKLGSAFDSLAGVVGYKAKSAEPVDLSEVDTLLKSDLPEPVRKALGQFVQVSKQVETLTAALELEQTQKAEAIEKLTKAEEAEIKRECVEKAQRVPLLGVEKDALAELLRKARTMDSALADELYNILKAAHEQVKKSGLFDVIGTSMAAPDSPLGRIEAIAKEKVEKSEGKLTIQKARAEAWKENPELATEYQAEHEERQGRRR